MKVFYLDANNNPVAVDGVTYDATNKCAVFETDHFSDWFVDVVSAGNNDGGFPIWIVIIAIIAVIAVAIVFFLMKSGKLGKSA